MSHLSQNPKRGDIPATEVTPGIERSDSLTDLAARINAAHQAAAAALKDSVVHAIHAGELLIEAKEKLGRHGEWLSWLKANFPFSDRTARLYMQVARRRAEVEAKMATVADLTLRDVFVELEPKSDSAEAKTNGATPAAIGHYRAMGSGSVEWFTPPEIVGRVRAVLGEINVDPASCDKAQEIVQAARYYTVYDDGMTQPWYGRVFLNPPLGIPHVANFTGKFIAEYTAGNMSAGVMLTHASSDAAWYHQLLDHADALCIVRGRIRFLGADGRECGAPPQGQSIFYIGPDPATFAQKFAEVGRTVPLRAVWGRAEAAAFGDAWMARSR
jgi:hypothetical protein